jgi:type I restriction enzyme S subunit
MDSQQNIPKNWSLVKVGDISLRIHYGYTASAINKNTGTKILRITDIQDYKVDWNNVPFCEIDEYDRPKFQLKPNDIVFARTGATVGKSFLITGNIPNAVFASYLIRIQLATSVIPQYLYYFFQSADYWNQIESKSIGTGQPNVNATSLSEIILPLPSTKEQLDITNKIEELFSEVDKSIESLEKTKRQLELYKLVLLKNAFEGKLSIEWRQYHKKQLLNPLDIIEENLVKRQEFWEGIKLKEFKKRGKPPKNNDWKRKYVSPRQPEPLGFSIPEEWISCSFDQISNWITYGFTRPVPRTFDGRAVITAKNIFDNKIDFSISDFTSVEAYNSLSEKDKPMVGDILITKDGTIGRAAIVNKESFCISQSVAVIWLRSTTKINRRFLLYYLESPYAQNWIKNNTQGSTIKHLSISDLPRLSIPLPCYQEQCQVVQELDEKLSLVENLRKTIVENIKKSDSLRIQILDNAFRGELTEGLDGGSVKSLLRSIKLEKEAFLEALKARPRKIKRINMEQELKGILETLKDKNAPMEAKKLWESSIYQGDIEAFYAELKRLIESGKVQELPRQGKESFITLTT